MTVETKHTYVCDCCKQKFDNPLPFSLAGGEMRSGPDYSSAVSDSRFRWVSGTVSIGKGRIGLTGDFCSVQCAVEGFRGWLLFKPEVEMEKTGLFGRKKK